MDHYHIWFNLKSTHKDLEFAQDVERYLGHLRDEGRIASYMLSRRKLGFGPPELGEFHIVVTANDLAQLDSTFQLVAARTGVVEDLHRRVYSAITDFRAALYRDFPDAARTRSAPS